MGLVSWAQGWPSLMVWSSVHPLCAVASSGVDFSTSTPPQPWRAERGYSLGSPSPIRATPPQDGVFPRGVIATESIHFQQAPRSASCARGFLCQTTISTLMVFGVNYSMSGHW